MKGERSQRSSGVRGGGGGRHIVASCRETQSNVVGKFYDKPLLQPINDGPAELSRWLRELYGEQNCFKKSPYMWKHVYRKHIHACEHQNTRFQDAFVVFT